MKPKSKSVKYKCPRNTNHKVQSRGTQIYCYECVEFFTKARIDKGDAIPEGDTIYSFRQDGENGIVQASTDEVVMNEADLLRVCRIDTKVWEVDRFTVAANSGYRKNKKSSWHVQNGKVLSGHVEDTGEILRAPLYFVKGWLVRKSDQIRRRAVIQDLLNELKKKSPKVKAPKILRPAKMVYEIDMPDLHFGKLTSADETNEEYNIKIATERALYAIGELLEYSKFHKIDRILIPWGNDFFNSDTPSGTTTKGTPQQNDDLFRRTFKLGRKLAQDVVSMCADIAPVDLLMMSGNHDNTTVFFLGEVMDALYANSKRITVDNRPISRKYRHYGKVLLGFAHGEEKVDKLPTTMLVANKEILAQTEFREWHLGHTHHKKMLELRHNEELQCVIRYLSSLTATDQWHFDNQYVGQVRSAQSFVWSPERGLIAEYHSNAR